jgi:hypothetical protein
MGRPKDDSTEGQKTQSFPYTIRCETVRFRLHKYGNGGQLWVVNVFSYTILVHAQTDCWPSRSPLALSIVFPLLLWRFPSSQLFCVHYTLQMPNSCRGSSSVEMRLGCQRLTEEKNVNSGHANTWAHQLNGEHRFYSFITSRYTVWITPLLTLPFKAER